MFKWILALGCFAAAVLPVSGVAAPDKYECGACFIVPFNDLGEQYYVGVYHQFFNGSRVGGGTTDRYRTQSEAQSRCSQLRRADGFCTGQIQSSSCSVARKTYFCNGETVSDNGCRVTCSEPPRSPVCAPAACVTSRPQPSRCYCNR